MEEKEYMKGAKERNRWGGWELTYAHKRPAMTLRNTRCHLATESGTYLPNGVVGCVGVCLPGVTVPAAFDRIADAVVPGKPPEIKLGVQLRQRPDQVLLERRV